ncbi:MAG: GWxTD domain-containing protein [Acidobacteria bacterium]|nr:MAG: GWxTD domain-containing protein [Acidobacteriota bacterium]REK01505.1 MAG: GWxTD domain-containing protein [Acidobacteriota bacterium]REK14461.1 MAG: GWxTD domain-containing protein [Acidobacteriota bacterium]REK45176.1 MAG: GWxTD domain-containing protein [Acidobacteriota bacterium]
MVRSERASLNTIDHGRAAQPLHPDDASFELSISFRRSRNENQKDLESIMKIPASSTILTAALFFTAFTTVIAQPPEPDQKNRTQVQEADKVYDDWISEDVAYIASKAEKEAYKKLATREEKENFIAWFWHIRDPNPDTEENEYREEFYERIAYANEHFASGIPGWKTDRGRIYITWGKPDSVESRPMGGAYNRPSWEGGGTTSTYPFEVWFYRNKDGLGTGIEFEFVDRSGTGEYRLSINPNDKDALLHIPGAGQTTNELLGIERRSDRIAGIGRNSFMREQDSPFIKLENIQKGLSPPPVRNSSPGSTVSESPVIDNNPLEFDMRIDLFRQGDSQVVATFTVVADNTELAFVDRGGVRTARLNILGHITSVTSRTAGSFQDSVVATEVSGDPVANGNRKSVYQTARTLTPGRYKVRVNLTDIESGSKGVREIGFEVPDYSTNELSTSTLVLASTLREAEFSETGSRFVIGGKKVIPNLTGIFKKGRDIGVYMQVYNAAIDQTTLKPSVDVVYSISKDGREILRLEEDWQGLSESAARITLARLIPTSGLDPGLYQIKLAVTDRTSNKPGLAHSAEFTVIE